MEPSKYDTATYVHEQLRRTEVIRKKIIEQHRREHKKKPEPEAKFQIVLVPYEPTPERKRVTREEFRQKCIEIHKRRREKALETGCIPSERQEKYVDDIKRQNRVIDPIGGLRGPKDGGIPLHQSNVDRDRREREHFLSSLDRYLEFAGKKR
jgi:hypothetical protein